MPYVSLEIHEASESPGCYSVKLNGKEIGKHICKLELALEAGRLPVMTVQSVVEGINLSSLALWDIPEPYKSWMEQETENEETPN